MSPIEFQQCRIAASDGSEEGRLCVKDGVILALLVRHDDRAAGERGWYLHSGFGPWQREGLVFRTLDEARTWLEQSASIPRG